MDEKVVKSRKELWTFFLIVGVAFIIFGAIHISSFATSGSNISMYDAIYNSYFGICFLVASWIVYKGKFIVLIIPILFSITVIAYSYAIGRSFNYFALLYSVILIPWILQLKNNKALS